MSSNEGMRQPGFRTAMLSHMWLAMRLGRPRPENFLTDAELQHIAAPVLMVWGDDDLYGGPEIGRRAAAVIPARSSRSCQGATLRSWTTLGGAAP